MAEEFDIPEELKLTFQRILKQGPHELKTEWELQKKIMVFLKLGGEKLARQRIELTKKQFRESYLLIDRLVPEAADEEAAEETLPDEA